ncbi:alpha/beta hydrolase-fold protein [Nocardia sp. CDC153]|uniref:alpha/beta hydrolase n=1 Tax=Nocardia sp. CDC153 TaxID=3112167 RepID=UPI002DB954CE|nr:alpha/beta hydrolase-fold protein [Nocardia sp. CDC153]MEC3953024.1 alpha/beta hydrolase-fold protein [Nocardia sp. CDC153]
MVEDYRAAARRFSRRSLFATTGLIGLAATGAAVAAGVNAAVDAEDTKRSPNVDQIRPAAVGINPVIRTERVYSQARGREVDLVTILPPGVPTENLPMSLLLHGLHGTARTAAVGNISGILAAAVASRLSPAFGFVALDGGDNYWHDHGTGDDPMSMLLNEVPGWLAQRRLGAPGGMPFAVAGTSMGGFGAFVYARRRFEQGRPVNAVATMSPGLLTSWTEMAKRKAFLDADQWAALDPLRNLDKLGPAPIGLWCGDRDRFIEGCRKFIAAAKPEVGLITPGAHTDEYWSTVTPDVVRFLSRHVG